PSPSWPAPLSPQHRTVPSMSSAQVKNDPAASATAPLTPLTATGVSVGVVLPSPSCPEKLKPQHRTLPSSLIWHGWCSPAAIRSGASLMAASERERARVAPWLAGTLHSMTAAIVGIRTLRILMMFPLMRLHLLCGSGELTGHRAGVVRAAKGRASRS